MLCRRPLTGGDGSGVRPLRKETHRRMAAISDRWKRKPASYPLTCLFLGWGDGLDVRHMRAMPPPKSEPSAVVVNRFV
jgi:hypothetical protein